MRHSRAVLGMCAIGLAIITSVVVVISISNIQNQNLEFQWAVSVDDEFTYSILIRGFNTTFEYVPENESYIYYDSPLSIASLNESTVVAKIVNLPLIPDELNRSAFSDFVRSEKVNCSMLDGRGIQLEHRRWLNLLVSTAVLPIGGWAFLDDLCSDPPEHIAPTGNNQYTISSTDHFLIADAWGGVELGYWAQGNVSLESGVPISGYLERGCSITYSAPVTYSIYNFEIEIIKL
ncbi:MAG: hypothetical protein KAR33_10690 [Candidatus Thorarchaeota archaeon]|nr:hypothetical protein [Candidatus Thorarchaeota archaeon]